MKGCCKHHNTYCLSYKISLEIMKLGGLKVVVNVYIRTHARTHLFIDLCQHEDEQLIFAKRKFSSI